MSYFSNPPPLCKCWRWYSMAIDANPPMEIAPASAPEEAQPNQKSRPNLPPLRQRTTYAAPAALRLPTEEKFLDHKRVSHPPETQADISSPLYYCPCGKSLRNEEWNTHRRRAHGIKPPKETTDTSQPYFGIPRPVLIGREDAARVVGEGEDRGSEKEHGRGERKQRVEWHAAHVGGPARGANGSASGENRATFGLPIFVQNKEGLRDNIVVFVLRYNN
ncbi:hypothetical protein B0J14DRAFT_608672 [Halenospora varia]|nr:hypothetical protein B0J14DRAFT_608672 [Halenospora varia]